MAKKSIALITSLKTKTFKFRFKCFINIIFYSILSLVFLLIFNKTKFTKFSKKIKEILTYRTPKNYGHEGVSGSLIRGLKQLNIPFSVNDINRDTNTVILLWTDEKELALIEDLKRNKKIEKIVTTPECDLFTSGLRFKFATHPLIDKVLVACSWVKTKYEEKLSIAYQNCKHKIQPFASGVKVDETIWDNNFSKSCICYFKHTPINEKLIKMIEEKGIKVHCIEYYKYRFEDYMQLLEKVDFVVFNQNYIETQGLAIAEAWAKNCPTFINYDENEYGGVTAPYLTANTGLFYHNFDELEKILDEYIDQKQAFLDKFSPQKWTLENMSDKSSAQELLNLLEI